MARMKLPGTALGKSLDLDAASNSLAYVGETATARVFLRNTDGTSGSAATVYADPLSVTVLSQPLDADAQGRIPGWVDTGAVYNVEFTLGAVTWTEAVDAPEVAPAGSYTDENAQDAIGTILVDSGRIDFTYSDATPSITADIVAGSITNSHINASAAIALSKLATDPLARANHTGTQTASTISDFTEASQDAVGAALTDTASVDFTYNDGANTISAAVLPAGVDHNTLANLTAGDVHTQYALLAGRSGGQTLIGGTVNTNDLTLKANSSTITSGAVVIDHSGQDNSASRFLVAVKMPTTLTSTSTGIVLGTDGTGSGQTISAGAGSGIRGLSFSGTYNVQGEPAAQFGLVFNYGPTINIVDNSPSTQTDLNGQRIFNSAATYNMGTASGVAYGVIAADNSAGDLWTNFRSASILTATAAGTGSTATVGRFAHFTGAAGLTIGLNWTVTTYNGLLLQNPAGSGTVTNAILIDMEDLAASSLTLTNSPIAYRSQGTTLEMRHAGPAKFGANAAVSGTTASDPTVELERLSTITGTVADGLAGSLLLDPGYTAATAQTVTRHNYIKLEDVSNAGAGPSAVTDSCVLWLDAALNTHKATTNLDKTGNAKSGTLKVNVNGTIYHIQLYAA